MRSSRERVAMSPKRTAAYGIKGWEEKWLMRKLKAKVL